MYCVFNRYIAGTEQIVYHYILYDRTNHPPEGLNLITRPDYMDYICTLQFLEMSNNMKRSRK